jgi:hypothetical protein
MKSSLNASYQPSPCRHRMELQARLLVQVLALKTLRQSGSEMLEMLARIEMFVSSETIDDQGCVAWVGLAALLASAFAYTTEVPTKHTYGSNWKAKGQQMLNESALEAYLCIMFVRIECG